MKFSTGWQQTNEEGSKSPFKNKGPRRVWIPPEKTARLLFIDNDPTSVWDHQFPMNGTWENHELCKVKNKMESRCPVCDSDKKAFPRFTGLFTVINMTPWFTKQNVEVCFGREVFAPKIGSPEKPGVLKKIERLTTANGRIRGLIFDVFRSGKMAESCGDEFTLVEKIDEAQIEEYGRKQLAAYAERRNAGLPAKDHLTVQKLWERNPWTGINFEKLYETDWAPRSLAELDGLFAVGGSASRGGGGGSKDEPADDDNIPY